MRYISKYLEFNLTEIKFKFKENDLAYFVTNLCNIVFKKDYHYDSFLRKYFWGFTETISQKELSNWNYIGDFSRFIYNNYW